MNDETKTTDKTPDAENVEEKIGDLRAMLRKYIAVQKEGADVTVSADTITLLLDEIDAQRKANLALIGDDMKAYIATLGNKPTPDKIEIKVTGAEAAEFLRILAKDMDAATPPATPAEPVAWIRKRDLDSGQARPDAVAKLSYRSAAAVDRGEEYIPVYTAPPAPTPPDSEELSAAANDVLTDSQRPFNQLTPAEAERLALLAEECGEVVQAVGKVLRHGYESRHPDGGPTNREALERECGDVYYCIWNLIANRDIDGNGMSQRADDKARSIRRYLHHQPKIERLDRAAKEQAS